MERVQALVKAVVSATRKVVSGMTTWCQSKSVYAMAEEVDKLLVVIMERVQVLVKAVVSTMRKAVSGMTTWCQSNSIYAMAEEVAKLLVVVGLEVLLFAVFRALKCFLGGSGGIASVAIFVLEIIIILRPWKKY